MNTGILVTPLDIRSIRPDWSLERCQRWIEDNGPHVQTRVVEAAWKVVEKMVGEEVN